MEELQDGESYEDQQFLNLSAQKTRFSGIEFSDCTFEGCSFGECTFYRCSFSKCRFVNCDLGLLKVPNCRFNDVEFRQSKLIGIDWTTTDSSGVNRALFSVSFQDCVLDYCSFFGLTVAKTKLTRCSAIGVEFSEADLRETDCSGTDLAQTRFSRANLEKANFIGARNYGIDPLDCRIKGARFSLPEAALLLTSLGVVIED